MASATVYIDNKIYHIKCSVEQKPHIYELAQQIDQFIAKLRLEFGDLHHQQLALMTAMLHLDEIAHLKQQLQMAKAENQHLIDSIAKSANTIKTITAKLEAS